MYMHTVKINDAANATKGTASVTNYMFFRMSCLLYNCSVVEAVENQRQLYHCTVHTLNRCHCHCCMRQMTHL